MILVDTSVWIDHLRSGDDRLSAILDRRAVLMHPFVLGEVALGSMAARATILHALGKLPAADVATNGEVLQFIERNRLFGRGIGYVDCHLLASARLTSGARIWTRDKRLEAVATELGLADAGALQ